MHGLPLAGPDAEELQRTAAAEAQAKRRVAELEAQSRRLQERLANVEAHWSARYQCASELSEISAWNHMTILWMRASSESWPMVQLSKVARILINQLQSGVGIAGSWRACASSSSKAANGVVLWTNTAQTIWPWRPAQAKRRRVQQQWVCRLHCRMHIAHTSRTWCAALSSLSMHTLCVHDSLIN